MTTSHGRARRVSRCSSHGQPVRRSHCFIAARDGRRVEGGGGHCRTAFRRKAKAPPPSGRRGAVATAWWSASGCPIGEPAPGSAPPRGQLERGACAVPHGKRVPLAGGVDQQHSVGPVESSRVLEV